MAAKNFTSLPSSNHEAVLCVLAGLIAGNIPGCEAIENLRLLAAPAYLIDSVSKIELMFGISDCDYCGPLDEIVRRICGAA